MTDSSTIKSISDYFTFMYNGICLYHDTQLYAGVKKSHSFVRLRIITCARKESSV